LSTRSGEREGKEAVADRPHVDEVFEKVVYRETALSGEEFESCTFDNCDFSESDLADSLFTDCRFIDCNLSMAKVGLCGLRNVVFTNCKIVGVDFTNCLPFLFSVGFEKCSMDYCHFLRMKLKKTAFRECSIRDADFSESDLSGAFFDGCDLAHTIFSRTNLSNADLRTARNYSIDPEANILRKARFSLSGVAGLLERYEVVIE
jgi:fluoroquinolone resistance protein